MPGQPRLGEIASRTDPAALAKRIRDLEQRLDRITTARSLENAFIGRGGITIGEDGSLTVKDSDGHTVAIIGALPTSFNRADGSRQPGIVLYREDGTTAAVLADLNPLIAPYKQAWQVLDRASNVVMADDTNGGSGLAKPFVGGGVFLADTNVTRWPQTTNTSFVNIATGWYTVQNPRLSWDINMVCDSGTAGQVRLMFNGTQIGGTQTVGTSFIDWYSPNTALPAGTSIGSIYLIELQARVTSGAGSLYAIPQRFEGDQSP